MTDKVGDNISSSYVPVPALSESGNPPAGGANVLFVWISTKR
jgi:hypothetical protein